MRAPARLLAALLGLAVLLPQAGLLIATAGPADAAGRAPQWQAKVYPRVGTDDQPLQVVTSGGCPADAPNILGKVYGKGFPAAGTNVIGNTDAGVSHEGPFTTAVFTTLRDFMFDQPEPVPFEGVYRLVVTCRTPMYPRSHGDYVVAIRFTDPHHWRMAAPLSTHHGPTVPTGTSTAPGDAGVSPDDGSAPGPRGSRGTRPGRHGAGSTGPAGASGAAGSGSGSGDDGARRSRRAGSDPRGAAPGGSTARALRAGDQVVHRAGTGLGTTGWGLIAVGVVVAAATAVAVVRARPS